MAAPFFIPFAVYVGSDLPNPHQFLSLSVFFFFFSVFICLAASGLSCGMWNVCCIMQELLLWLLGLVSLCPVGS